MSDIVEALNDQADVLDSLACRALESGGGIDPSTSQVIMRRAAVEFTQLRAELAKAKASYETHMEIAEQSHDDNMAEAHHSALREAAAICNEYVQIAGVIDGMSGEEMDAFRKGQVRAAADLEDAIRAAIKDHKPTTPQPKGSTK